MRIAVSVILSQIAHGASTAETLQEYPDLEPADIQLAIPYAAWLSEEQIVIAQCHWHEVFAGIALGRSARYPAGIVLLASRETGTNLMQAAVGKICAVSVRHGRVSQSRGLASQPRPRLHRFAP